MILLYPDSFQGLTQKLNGVLSCPKMRWLGGTGHSQLLVVSVIQSRPLVLLMWLPFDGLVVGVQIGATEAITVLQEAWRE